MAKKKKGKSIQLKNLSMMGGKQETTLKQQSETRREITKKPSEKYAEMILRQREKTVSKTNTKVADREKDSPKIHVKEDKSKNKDISKDRDL